MQKKILVIDDEKDICTLLERFLNKKGYDCKAENDERIAFDLIRKNTYDLVICDLKLPSISGIELLQKIKLLSPQTKVIIITGYSDIKTTVEAMKYGASNYVSKPLYPDELLSVIKEAFKEEELKPQTKPSKKSMPSNYNSINYVVGESDSSRRVFDDINLVSPTDMSVLIVGETGTGKEYVAREIHERSSRKDKKFVSIDCGALPKDIASSELFGHVKGSFTGAISDKEGVFEYANGGTLFLDEIGNLSYDIQVKLLRVIQERKFKKLGGNKTQETDVRIIAATNEDLDIAIGNDEFRQDLYYRINEFKISLDPIRKRSADIMDFAKHFLIHANTDLNKEVSHFSDDVENIFKHYAWPGNLRELKNVVKRATLRATTNIIEKTCLPQEIVLYEQSVQDSSPADKTSLKSAAIQAEKETILKVLAETGNNKSKAAKILNIDRKTLYNKLKAFGI